MDLGIRGAEGDRLRIESRDSRKACLRPRTRRGRGLTGHQWTQPGLRCHRSRTAGEIRQATGVEVTPVAADVSTVEGQEALLAACPAPDILINNNGGPPYRDFRELDRGAMLAGVTMNMVTPIELIQKVVDSMAARGFGRIVNITSITVKMPLRPSGLDLLERRPGGPHGLRGRSRAQICRQERHHQQSSARQFRHPAFAKRLRGRLQANRETGISPGGAGHGGDSRQAIRHSRGVGANLCFSLQCSCRVPHRSEHPAGRRSVSGGVLGQHARGVAACGSAIESIVDAPFRVKPNGCNWPRIAARSGNSPPRNSTHKD